MSIEKSCNEPLALDYVRDVHFSESYYLPSKEVMKKRFPELFQIPPDQVKKRFVRKKKHD